MGLDPPAAGNRHRRRRLRRLKALAWARVVGIALASLSLISNFLFVPHYRLWSLLIIALDVAVIWALATTRAAWV